MAQLAHNCGQTQLYAKRQPASQGPARFPAAWHAGVWAAPLPSAVGLGLPARSMWRKSGVGAPTWPHKLWGSRLTSRGGIWGSREQAFGTGIRGSCPAPRALGSRAVAVQGRGPVSRCPATGPLLPRQCIRCPQYVLSCKPLL